MDGRSGTLAPSVNADLGLDVPCQAASDAYGGLGMSAKTDIAAGRRILLEQPLTITPCPAARPYTCANCFADSRFSDRGEKLRADGRAALASWSRCCAGCGTLRFCADSCEQALAKRHRHSCEC